MSAVVGTGTSDFCPCRSYGSHDVEDWYSFQTVWAANTVPLTSLPDTFSYSRLPASNSPHMEKGSESGRGWGLGSFWLRVFLSATLETSTMCSPPTHKVIALCLFCSWRADSSSAIGVRTFLILRVRSKYMSAWKIPLFSKAARRFSTSSRG
jgi:hypothetical protein